jgi:hypothetical protein
MAAVSAFPTDKQTTFCGLLGRVVLVVTGES